MNTKKMNAFKLVPALIMLAVIGSALPANAADMRPSAKEITLMGAPASQASADRTLVITSDTRYVNVIGGETINFVVGDKSFGWHFDGPLLSFKLNYVVPEGFFDHVVTVYVSPNPLYFGG